MAWLITEPSAPIALRSPLVSPDDTSSPLTSPGLAPSVGDGRTGVLSVGLPLGKVGTQVPARSVSCVGSRGAGGIGLLIGTGSGGLAGLA